MKYFLTSPILLRTGLACVFLANALTAFLLPGDFQALVVNSFVAPLLALVPFVSLSTFVMLIGLNDLTVALLLFVGWRTSGVATYATLWITGVVFLVFGLFTLEALEHLGFIALALSLALQEERRR